MEGGAGRATKDVCSVCQTRWEGGRRGRRGTDEGLGFPYS